MEEVGHLLELLYAAPLEYRTVQGTLRNRSNLSLSQEAHRRWEQRRQQAGWGGGTAYMYMVGEGPAAERPEEHELLARFWSEPPERLREEVETIAPHPHRHLTVRDGRHWWTYSPDWGAVSNVGVAPEEGETFAGGGELWSTLLEPAALIAVLRFEPRGEAEAGGRTALRVRARAREPATSEPFFFRTQLPLGADEYELLLDYERGVVLRAAALLDGEEFWLSAFEQLTFDQELPPATFVFEPPPGVEIRRPDAGMHEPVTIAEATRRASFPLFYFPELPEGRWELHVMYVPPSDQPRLKESVHLSYHRADATHHLMVTERPAADDVPESGWVEYPPPGVEGEEVEHAGRRFSIHRADRRHGVPSTIIFVRDGTAIQLSSPNIDEQTLLDLAASMERFAS